MDLTVSSQGLAESAYRAQWVSNFRALARIILFVDLNSGFRNRAWTRGKRHRRYPNFLLRCVGEIFGLFQAIAQRSTLSDRPIPLRRKLEH